MYIYIEIDEDEYYNMSSFATFSLFADVAIDKSELSASGSLQDPRGKLLPHVLAQ